jgi:hypothetical protein
MKLNGWVRLWIVHSVAWIAFAGWLTYDDLSITYGTTIYEVSKEGVGNFTVVFRMLSTTHCALLERRGSKKLKLSQSNL